MPPAREAAFDRLTRLARAATGAPVSLVSFLDRAGDRQIFASQLGLREPWATARGTPLSHSFCRLVVEDGAPLAVADARADPRVRGNPAIEALGVVAYLGVPLLEPGGAAVGALCAIDGAPRAWRARDLVALRDLAGLAASELALRREAAEREEALREVRAIAARYRAVVQDQTELICRFLPDTTRTFVNDAYARFFGLAKRALLGTPWIEHVPLPARAGVLARIAALRPGEAVTIEHEVLRPDGAIGWQQWTDRALTGPDGRIAEFQSVGRDITDRKRLELDLTAAKRLVDDALASMSDAFAIYDADRLVVCNAIYRGMFLDPAGLPPVGAAVQDVLRGVALGGRLGRIGDVEAWVAGRLSLFRAHAEDDLQLADGRWLNVLRRPTASGGTVVVCRDVTERKRLELRLAEAKARLDDALASMGDGLALYDARERFVLCNRRYLELFPRSADLRVPGAWVRDVWREEAARGVYRGVDSSNVEAWIAERRARTAAGAQEDVELADGRWLQFRVNPTAEGGTIVAARDVTELRQAQRTLEHAAGHDPLCGLANRAVFLRELERARARAERAGHGLAVMLLDLDRFKQVNDAHGHAAGDALLVEMAARLKDGVRAGDLAARLGGDEFAVLAEARDRADIEALAARLVARLAEPARLGGNLVLRPGASLGLTVFPDDPAEAGELVAHADRALYAVKAAGAGGWAAFVPPAGAPPAPGGAAAPPGAQADSSPSVQRTYAPMSNFRSRPLSFM